MLMCPRASSSAGKLQGGYRMQTLLMMRNMVWRISNWSFRTIKLRFSSCCCGITTGKTVLFFPIFSSSLILYILLPWQLNIFCPSVWWQSRYIHLFMNLVFKRQIIFSQLLYVFKPLRNEAEYCSFSKTVVHKSHRPGSALPRRHSSITHCHHKWKSRTEAGDKDQETLPWAHIPYPCCLCLSPLAI